ncbi:MotE family protein [Cohaesibacter celericrescens]|uniref:Magnesium transporter MgtE intracellular domain-containing protein n=1 Tax=Cohaesibacter celericrescens TaxID=2067669 RepID=A0A2N5XLT2_9HYPH|nr:MotE family protein [Cohaesibacter celericrescens]PLW75496.1 hypothetical protein C0081_19340 [Cohaesibacter celericrescens]PLW78903.1 hypothetical protein C0081_01300 [Cohaesibacter celericrescens]
MISLSGLMLNSSPDHPSCKAGIRLALCALLGLAMASGAHAKSPAVIKQSEQATNVASETDAKNYCANIANVAKEQRIAWQIHNLVALQTDIDERTQKLSQLRADVRSWIEKRDKILLDVKAHIVSVYERMRPDAAAERLAKLDNDIAIALLTKMQPRIVGGILNEMDPDRASVLTQGMASLVELETGEDIK